MHEPRIATFKFEDVAFKLKSLEQAVQSGSPFFFAEASQGNAESKQTSLQSKSTLSSHQSLPNPENAHTPSKNALNGKSYHKLMKTSILCHAVMEKKLLGGWMRCKKRFLEFQPATRCIRYWHKEGDRCKGRAKCLDQIVSIKKEAQSKLVVCYGLNGEQCVNIRFDNRNEPDKWLEVFDRMTHIENSLDEVEETVARSQYEISNSQSQSSWESCSGSHLRKSSTSIDRTRASPKAQKLQNLFGSELRKQRCISLFPSGSGSLASKSGLSQSRTPSPHKESSKSGSRFQSTNSISITL